MVSVSKVKIRACAVVGTGASERISLNQCIISFDGPQEDNFRQGTVQFNYNFTHAWNTLRGNTHDFAGTMPKFVVGLIIYTRRWMLFTRDETSQTCNSQRGVLFTRRDAWSSALEKPASIHTCVGLRMRLATANCYTCITKYQ